MNNSYYSEESRFSSPGMRRNISYGHDVSRHSSYQVAGPTVTFGNLVNPLLYTHDYKHAIIIILKQFDKYLKIFTSWLFDYIYYPCFWGSLHLLSLCGEIFTTWWFYYHSSLPKPCPVTSKLEAWNRPQWECFHSVDIEKSFNLIKIISIKLEQFNSSRDHIKDIMIMNLLGKEQIGMQFRALFLSNHDWFAAVNPTVWSKSAKVFCENLLAAWKLQ